ncbi:MAG TPA: hypothetical protein P5280_03615 [Cyclobacteriaceae bacterium]|nr:hypothetical protein [Cyclobacteriaceae bacterium]
MKKLYRLTITQLTSIWNKLIGAYRSSSRSLTSSITSLKQVLLAFFENVWGKIVRKLASIFTDRVHRLWRWPLTAAIFVLLLSLGFQSLFFLSDIRYDTFSYKTWRTQNGIAELSVRYPEQIRYKSKNNNASPIMIWIEPISDTNSLLTYTVKLSSLYENLSVTELNGEVTSPVATLNIDDQLSHKFYVRAIPNRLTPTVPLTVSLTERAPNGANVLLVNEKIDIQVQQLLTAWFLSLVELLFGPTTSLLAVVAILGNLGLSQWLIAQEKQQQREHNRAVNDRVSAIQRIPSLLKHNPEEAVKIWMEYEENRKGNKLEWTDDEVKKAADAVKGEIADFNWCIAILEQSRDSNDAVQRIQLLTIDKSIDYSQGPLLRMIEHHKKIGVLQKDTTTTDIIKSVLELFRMTDNQSARHIAIDIIIQIVVSLIEIDLSSMIVINKELIGYDEGKKLLREPEIVRKIVESEHAVSNRAPAIKEASADILRAIRSNNVWVSPWPTSQPLELTHDWLKNLGFKYNPFGPEHAELDGHLIDYYTYPLTFESSITGARPSIIFGDEGSGKTAAALKLTHDCKFKPAFVHDEGSFPIYHNLLPETLQDCTYVQTAKLVIHLIAEEILHFIVKNPYEFLDHTLDSRIAIARCLLFDAGSTGSLLNHLRQAGPSESSAARRLEKELRELGLIENFPIEQQIVNLEFLQNAKPVSFSRTYLVLDVHHHDVIDAEAVVPLLQHLLRLIIPLARLSIYVKLFLPLSLYGLLSTSLSGDIVTAILEADNEATAGESEVFLTDLIEQRLKQAGGAGDINELFDSRLRPKNPGRLLIREAKGSPRLLIRLGNQLIHANISRSRIEGIRPGEFTQDDLDKVLGSISSE